MTALYKPWQRVEETFPSKLLLLMWLKERGAENHDVSVLVQSPM